MLRNLHLVLFLSIAAHSGFAQTTWSGAVSTSWNNAANWSAGVPNSGLAAIIPPTANSPTTNGVASPACSSLTVQAGATLTIANGFPLSAQGSVSCAGTVTGQLRLLGTGTVATTGTGTIDFLRIFGGPYSITDASLGSLTQEAGAAAVTITLARVLGNCTFNGAGLVGAPGSLLDCDGGVTVRTTVPTTSPPNEIRLSTFWDSNASWQPASGRVVSDGTLGPVFTVTPGTTFYELTIQSQLGATIQGDLQVGNSLQLLSDLVVNGTTIDVSGSFGIGVGVTLSGASVTSLRLHNGVLAAGRIIVPQATMDADGSMTFFVSGRLEIGGGTHRISNSFNMAGTLVAAPSSTVDFDGSGTVNVAAFGIMPNVRFSGSNYTLLDASIGGTLVQPAGAGNLAIQRCHVLGLCTFAGNSVVDFNQGQLDADGGIVWQTASVVTTPPSLIQCAGSWTSTANFAPTSGTVVFDGSGAQSVSVPAFLWHGLRIAASSQVSTALAVRTTGLCEVLGTLTTSGASVEIGGLATIGGTLQAGASTWLRAHAGLTVDGTVQAAAARLEVDGNLTVSGSLVLGNGPHEASGSLTVPGSLVLPASQQLVLDGAGTVNIAGTNVIPRVRVAGGSYVYQQLHVGIDLVQQTGTIAVASCLVDGSASFLGAGLTDSATGLLDVRGDVTVQSSAPVTAPPATIRCGGNWTADASFAPASGLVELDGLGVQVVTMPVFQWFDLRIGPAAVVSTLQSATTLGFLEVRGSLTVGGASVHVADKLTVDAAGSLVAATATTIVLGAGARVDGLLGAGQAALTALGDYFCNGSGTSVLGNGPHAFQKSLLCGGSLVLPAGAQCRFLGTGTVDVASLNVVPQVLFAGSTYVVLNLNVQGLVDHQLGRLIVRSLHTLGDVHCNGLSVENLGSGVLDARGNLDFFTTNVITSPPLLIRCGGAWSSNAQFLPVAGTVQMDGSAPQTMIAPVLSLASLRVAAGSTVAFGLNDVIVRGDLTVDGAVSSPGNTLEVRGDLVVGSLGALQIGNGSQCTVAVDTTNAGAISGPGALQLVGTGTLSGGGTFADVTVDTSGTILASGSLAVGGLLRLDGGTLRLLAGASLHVTADCEALGGTLGGAAGAVLDVDGNLTLDGTTAEVGGVPQLRCAGDFIGGGSFTPAAGALFLDGTGDLVSLGGALTFGQLEVTSGTRTVVGNVSAIAPTLTVAAGATLDVGGNAFALDAATMTVNGTLAAGAGSLLTLAAGNALTIAASGTLRLVGTFEQPAVVDGTGAYSFQIGGQLEAMNFEFGGMGAQGIRVLASATLAPSPRDLRGGLFRNGAGGPGSTLLHIDRNVSTQFRYLRFDTPGTATFNVRSSGTGHIRLVNEGGNFAGPAHEDDPGSVIDWLPAERTQLVAFTATAAIHRVELAFATSSEVDAMELRLQRALAATGPWIDVVGSPLVPLGSPGAGANYALTDLLVVDTTKYFYRLREVLLHGEPRLLDDDFARPWPQQYGNSWYVGTNGGYPDIASAVTAASPGGNIIVQAGTYPAFTIDKPVRIFPDGSGPVHIDTTLGKLLVQNIPAGAVDLALYGLIVGSATSAFGMEVRNCDNVIVLDGLQVTTGTGVPGLRIDDATRVAVQSCAFVGDPGLQVTNGSRVYLSLGSVDELTVSALARVTYCNVTPGSLTVAPGAVASLRPGTMPGISFRPAWHGEKPVQMTVTAQPLSIYGVVYAPARDYLDLTLLFPIDMVLLVDQSQAVTLLVGLTPPSGSHAFQVIAPANALGWGTNLPLQILELRPDSTGRLGTSRDVVFLP